MKAREEAVLKMAIEYGVKRGIRRFYKHRDDGLEAPVAEGLADVVADDVMDEIDSWFTFSEGEGE